MAVQSLCDTSDTYPAILLISAEINNMAGIREKGENGTLWIRTSRKKTKVEYEVPLPEVPLHKV